MKKLLILPVLVSFLFSMQIYADGKTERYAAYSTGVNSLLIEHSLHSISNWVKNGEVILNAVVAPDFDFSNPSSVSIKLQPGFEIVTPLPAEFSEAASPAGMNFSVKKTADQSVVNWKLFIRKIQKTTIPFNLNFGTSNPVNTATPNFAGWSYRSIDMNNTYPRLSGKSQAFLLAFNPCSNSDLLVCNFYASNENDQTGLSASVEASADGISWVVLKTFNNDVPKNTAPAPEKSISLPLVEGYQYIRFQLLNRTNTDPSVCLNFFQLKKK